VLLVRCWQKSMTDKQVKARQTVTLKNGLVLENHGDGFPPLQDVADVKNACDICPVRLFCNDNNEFDCQVYGMFDGFYFGIDDALSFVSLMRKAE